MEAQGQHSGKTSGSKASGWDSLSGPPRCAATRPTQMVGPMRAVRYSALVSQVRNGSTVAFCSHKAVGRGARTVLYVYAMGGTEEAMLGSAGNAAVELWVVDKWSCRGCRGAGRANTGAAGLLCARKAASWRACNREMAHTASSRAESKADKGAVCGADITAGGGRHRCWCCASALAESNETPHWHGHEGALARVRCGQQGVCRVVSLLGPCSGETQGTGRAVARATTSMLNWVAQAVHRNRCLRRVRPCRITVARPVSRHPADSSSASHPCTERPRSQRRTWGWAVGCRVHCICGRSVRNAGPPASTM